MDQLREHIRKEIKNLMEGQTVGKHKAPPVIINALRELFPSPIVRYVENLKAANTIPPSYRVFLREGGKFFDLILEKASIVAKIGPKSYWLMNDDETLEAIKELDRLLRAPVLNPGGEEEEDTEDTGEETGGGTSSDVEMEAEPEEEEEA
jgi:hypothetical protein